MFACCYCCHVCSDESGIFFSQQSLLLQTFFAWFFLFHWWNKMIHWLVYRLSNWWIVWWVFCCVSPSAEWFGAGKSSLAFFSLLLEMFAYLWSLHHRSMVGCYLFWLLLYNFCINFVLSFHWFNIHKYLDLWTFCIQIYCLHFVCFQGHS